MNSNELQQIIEPAFEDWQISKTKGGKQVQEAVHETFALLETGEIRVAERQEDGKWVVNQWIKKAILLYFSLSDAAVIEGAPHGAHWWDKVPSRFAKMDRESFEKAKFRAVPGSIVRCGSYIGPQSVIMPSFINVGAYVGEGTMIDTWATVGSCAQIGRHVHLSGGAGIGGVLEPLQASPVIVEDHCFIGARSEVVEGCIIREGAVLAPGVFLSMSTKIIDRKTGKIYLGEVPPFAVVVPGSLPGSTLPNGDPGPCIYCAVIIKQVDERTRSKISINDLLRS